MSDQQERVGGAVSVPYGQGTSENGGCDECWEVPSRHCCLWNDPAQPPAEDDNPPEEPA